MTDKERLIQLGRDLWLAGMLRTELVTSLSRTATVEQARAIHKGWMKCHLAALSDAEVLAEVRRLGS